MNVLVFDISKLKISENIHSLVYRENILSYAFLDGTGNLQDSAKPRNNAKNLNDQTLRYCGRGSTVIKNP